MTALEHPTSFGMLIRRAVQQHPDALAVIDGPHRWSWVQLSQLVNRAASALRGCGLRTDDRLAIQLPTSAEFVALYLAALQADLVVVPINPAYTLPELEYILNDSGARMLVTDSVGAVEAAADLRRRHPALEHIVLAAGSGTDELPSINELIEAAAELDADWVGERTGEQLAVLLYTSGTSSRPKGAMLPVRALLSNLQQLAGLVPPPLSADDRVFLPVPLCHAFGLNAGLGMALYFGATLVLAAKFDATQTLATIQDEQITVVVAAPVEFARWAAQPAAAAAFAGVRYALSGAAALSAELIGGYSEMGVQLFQGYGLTEAAPVVTVNLALAASGNGWADPKPGSVGRPLPGVDVRLVDTDHELTEAGDVGMLEVRGANLFTGYWPDGSGGPDDEGWFATGDLAVADDDGDYHLVGRQADLALVNGFRVYPAEVEATFATLDGVQEVAVLGVPGVDHNDVIVAYVVPKPGTVLDTDRLLKQAAHSLATFKLPRQVIEVETLPHTATGKVQKWRLKEPANPAVAGLAGSDRSASAHLVTLITRAGCHLCEDAQLRLEVLSTELGFGLEVLDVDADRRRANEYSDRVPVFLIDGVEHGYWRLEEDRFVAALSR